MTLSPISKKIRILSLVFFAPLIFGGFNCSTAVRQLGPGTIEPNPASSSSGTNNFTISFGVRTTATEDDLEVQGGTSSAAAIAGGCGLNGVNCVCDFFTDAAGSGKVSSVEGSTSFFETGNFLRCQIPSATPASFTHMRVRDRSNLRISNTVEITNQDDADLTKRLTLLKILGDLPANETRKVYEYRCYINYLRKTGTTSTSFDCSTNPLSVVQVPYHYYLFADNRSNNFSTRVPDVLHSDGSGTLCGTLIKFIDCTTAADGAGNPNALTLKFGLYARAVGQFSIPVSLTNAPGRLAGFTTSYGFAAKFDSTNNLCPPGLEARQFYQITPAAVADSNLSSTLADRRVFTRAATFSMLVDSFAGGTCNGTTCTAPNSDRDNGGAPANIQTVDYVAQTAANETFCVLPDTLLSGI
jgi:hypothetical protein